MYNPFRIDPSEVRVTNPRDAKSRIAAAAMAFERSKLDRAESARLAAVRAQEEFRLEQQRQLREAVLAAKNREAIGKYRLVYDRLSPVEPTIEEIEQIAPRKRKVVEILADVAKAHGVTVDMLRSPRRTGPLVEARMEAYYTVASERPDISFPEIGRYLGGKDHTTVMYGVRVYAERHGLPPVVRS